VYLLPDAEAQRRSQRRVGQLEQRSRRKRVPVGGIRFKPSHLLSAYEQETPTAAAQRVAADFVDEPLRAMKIAKGLRILVWSRECRTRG